VVRSMGIHVDIKEVAELEQSRSRGGQGARARTPKPLIRAPKLQARSPVAPALEALLPSGLTGVQTAPLGARTNATVSLDLSVTSSVENDPPYPGSEVWSPLDAPTLTRFGFVPPGPPRSPRRAARNSAEHITPPGGAACS